MESVILLFFVLGLILGSFFNVVGLRVPKKQSFTISRSFCPHCNRTLSWHELIPVLSFIIQHGKCRNCKETISLMYPLIELATGFLFAFSFLQVGFTVELIKSFLLMSLLVIITVSDITYMVIPNKVLLFFLPLFIIMCMVQPLVPWWSSIVGGVVGFAMIAIVILVSRGGMGAGDMNLFAVLGIVLGIQNVLLAFFISCIIGSFIGLFLISFKIIDRKQPIPFGPYIVVATLITYFYGDGIVNWYINILI